jgi:Uma2 family endonuclease
MNSHAPRPTVQTTQAAEGLPRRRWTVAEIFQLVETGIIPEHERFELIGGEIVPMAAKGVSHETVKMELNRFWGKAMPDGVAWLTETTLHINDHEFLEPDFIFWPRSVAVKDVTPDCLLLVVEVADSSLTFDLGRKAKIYEQLAICDYCAIKAKTLVTYVHRLGSDGKYLPAVAVSHTEQLTPLHLPALAITLAHLGLQPMAA